MVDDTVSLLQLLRDRFGKNSYVAGFSLGATIGAYAAARRPDLVAKLVAVGTDVDGVAGANSAYDFALSTALQRGNKRAIPQLEAIGPPPHLDAKQFAIRVRWASNFGGVTTNETYGAMVRGLLASLLRSPDYSPRDVLRTVRGITATQSAPAARAGGPGPRTYPASPRRTDRHGPRPPGPGGARRHRPAVSDSLEATSKQLVWFENSAHTPTSRSPRNSGNSSGKFEPASPPRPEPRFPRSSPRQSQKPTAPRPNTGV